MVPMGLPMVRASSESLDVAQVSCAALHVHACASGDDVLFRMYVVAEHTVNRIGNLVHGARAQIALADVTVDYCTFSEEVYPVARSVRSVTLRCVAFTDPRFSQPVLSCWAARAAACWLPNRLDLSIAGCLRSIALEQRQLHPLAVELFEVLASL